MYNLPVFLKTRQNMQFIVYMKSLSNKLYQTTMVMGCRSHYRMDNNDEHNKLWLVGW